MSIKIPALTVKTRFISILTAILMISLTPAQSNAQLSPRISVSLRFPRGRNLGAPPRTSGAGSRGPTCGNLATVRKSKVNPSDQTSNQKPIPLTAITPTDNILTTAAADPTIYVYVAPAADKQAQFRLIDIEQQKIVYQTDLSLANTPEILKVSIPTTVNLKDNYIYQWQVLVICNPENREADKVVQGWLKHIPLTPEQALQIQQVKPNSLEQAKLYSQFGYWHETVMILDQLRKNNPQAQTVWVELLDSVDLKELANISDVDCCSFSAQPSPPEN
jgi:hypothetical protein